jgi:hypothetical protein
MLPKLFRMPSMIIYVIKPKKSCIGAIRLIIINQSIGIY